MYRTVRRLAFFLAIALSVTLAGFGSAAAANRAPVVVGFKGVPPPGFHNVLLNVIAVRLNPSASAAPTGSGWQKITVPAAIGGGGSAPAELQIDLNDLQNIPQLFNTGRIKPNTYRIAQLILDPTNPGTLVPNCPQAGGVLEGCINYPFQLENAGSPINVTSPKGMSGGLVSPGGKHSLASLILQLTMKVTKFPTSPGGAFTVSLTMDNIPGPNQVFGTVTGSVPTGPGSNQKATRKLTVTAETIGTNTTIASAPVTPNASGTGGTYTLVLPAADTIGTLYDLAVAGGKDSYAAARLLGLTPGVTIVQDFTKLSINETIGSISGKITDDCTGSPISNATIQLLIPPLSNPKLEDGSGDCTAPGNAAQCVSVATATTDLTGHFPQPGTLVIPSEFDSVPVLTGKTYTMMVSAPGYDTLVTPVNAVAGGGNDNCLSNGTTFVPCKIALSTGFITGNIPINAPQPGQTTLVQVFAEDTGTNNIVGALPMPIIVRSSSGGNPAFKINVPTGRTFDLFASTIDTYQGVSEPADSMGHTIAVIPNVTGPTPPSGPGACDTAPAPASSDTITCVGHGSISGFAAGADLGTSVGLAKEGVQITNVPVQNIGPNSPSTNTFTFCVPGGDTYTLQRFQLPPPPLPVAPTPTTSPTSAPSPTATPPLIAPTAAATGGSTDVPVPAAPTTGGTTATATASTTPTPSPTPTGGATPTATLTPTGTPTPTLKCPTTCSNPGGTCPGICNTVPGVSLP